MRVENKSVLPKALVEQIDVLDLSRIQRSKCYRLADIIFKQKEKVCSDYLSFIPLSQKSLKHTFKDSSLLFLYKMKAAGIIQVESDINESGISIEKYKNKKGQGQCKRYRINPDLISGEYTLATYKAKNEGMDLIKIGETEYPASVITDKLATLEIDYMKLLAIAKWNSMPESVTRNIEAIRLKEFTANRDPMNGRIVHNLSTLPSVLVETIVKDNGFVRVEIKNSLFAILAWSMSKDLNFIQTVDYRKFAENSVNGTLYKLVQYVARTNTLEDAEHILIKILLRHKDDLFTDTKLISNLFPSVYQYTKQRTGQTGGRTGNAVNFESALQQIESDFIIDCVYSKLLTLGLFAIQIKGSIFVKRDQAESIVKLMQSEAKTMGLLCTSMLV